MSNRQTTLSSPVDEMESYLKLRLPVSQIVSLLKTMGKDEKEIDVFVSRYEDSRKKIRKYIRRFVRKIESKYGDLDIPELMTKGMKFAKKHNFTQVEENAFINQVMSGDVDQNYFANQEIAYTEMSKFLGFSTIPLMNIKATDQTILDEIAKLYEVTKNIHGNVKQGLISYKSCDIEAVTGKYDKEKHNIGSFIHPVVVALFLPKLAAIERRMLISNIGRMIVQKSIQFLRHFRSESMSTTKIELDADLDLMQAIAVDPNSMNYFNDDTPLTNLLKRFKIQIELYKNVISLRTGRYYSKSDNENVDFISGLGDILQSYEWHYFDTPELYHVQDEGSFLRKLLAVFSFRPTFTQLSSMVTTSSMGYSNFGSSKIVYINTPIINVKLPRNNNEQTTQYIRLNSSLTQTENFIENKMIIPKHKSVMHSRDLVFFYANRRYHTVNFTNMDMSFRYINLPNAMSNVTNINQTELHFDDAITIGSGNEKFFLRSVVVLNKLSKSEFATTGCSSIVVSRKDTVSGESRQRPIYFYYNPITANLMFQKNGAYVSNAPVMVLSDVSGPNKPGFQDMARKFGTIFVYSNKEDDASN